MKKPARRAFTPKFSKPVVGYCTGCPLEVRGTGYVPAYGSTADILFLGEAPWFDEVAWGEPLVGASGSMLSRVLKLLGRTREQYRIDNLCRCAVPGMEIQKFPGAVEQCRYWQDSVAAALPKVVVPLGSVATRKLLNIPRGKNTGVENFHGTVTRDPLDRFWVVPSYHPSHLQRGATNLMGVVAFDIQRAQEVAAGGWAPDPAVKVIDPPRDWFAAWAQEYILAARQDPYAYPLAVDIETPEKAADEGTLIGLGEDATYQILRVNFSCHPDEGVTVPATPEYWDLIKAILEAGGVQYYWYKGYDYPRLVAAGAQIPAARAWDCMWMWKALQSDLPMGLGFAAPFYSRYGAWKHLSEARPGEYAAVDGFQTRRVGDGCVGDLVKTNRWDVFERHMHHFHRVVLQPATDVGVPIDKPRLMAFKETLDGHAARLLTEIQGAIPQDLLPVTPKDGLTRPPVDGQLHAKATRTKRDGTAKKDVEDPLKQALYSTAKVVERIVLKEVLVCRTCGKQEIAKTHACQPKLRGVDGPAARPILERDVVSVTRWYWQEPFNPDSAPQMMAYVIAKGHVPGKSKATGNDSVDRETLSRLIRETRDPLYAHVLDYRAVQKVNGTYVKGTERRLDSDDRVHPTTTFKPSTMRTSQVNPNIQNVVADKGGSDSLAAGFRDVVVARGMWVDAGSGWEDEDDVR